MKKISLLVVSAVMAVSAGVSAQEVRPYIGTTNLLNPFGNAAVGFHIGENFRVEGNMNYTTATTQSFTNSDANRNTNTSYVGVTGFYDFTTDSMVRPFVGLSLGNQTRNVKDNGNTITDTSSTWFGGQVGVAFGLTEKFNLDLAVKYDYTNIKDADKPDTNLRLGLGARLAF